MIFGDYSNSFDELMEYFGIDRNSRDGWYEFKAFWLSLTDEQRKYYRYVDLSK